MPTSRGRHALFHLFSSLSVHVDDVHRLLKQCAELDETVPGGIKAYVERARKLLADSKAGVNPYDGAVHLPASVYCLAPVQYAFACLCSLLCIAHTKNSPAGFVPEVPTGTRVKTDTKEGCDAFDELEVMHRVHMYRVHMHHVPMPPALQSLCIFATWFQEPTHAYVPRLPEWTRSTARALPWWLAA